MRRPLSICCFLLVLGCGDDAALSPVPSEPAATTAPSADDATAPTNAAPSTEQAASPLPPAAEAPTTTTSTTTSSTPSSSTTTTTTTTTSATTAPATTAPATTAPATTASTTPPSATPPSATAASEKPFATEAQPTAATTTTYTFNTGASALYVQVFKDASTLGARLSHDHVMVARSWTGSVSWHPTDPAACKVSIAVPVAKLEVDPAAMRRRVGYDSELSESQRKEVRESMLAAGQLDGERFSTVSFTSRSCSGTTGAVTVEGDLTLLGQSRPLSIKATVNLGEGSFSAKGNFSLKGSDWGLSPFKAMGGALKNQDKLKFTFDLAGKAS